MVRTTHCLRGLEDFVETKVEVRDSPIAYLGFLRDCFSRDFQISLVYYINKVDLYFRVVFQYNEQPI